MHVFMGANGRLAASCRSQRRSIWHAACDTNAPDATASGEVLSRVMECPTAARTAYQFSYVRGLLVKFQNSVDIPLPVEQAWKVLLDVPGIVPCLPGAELVEVESDTSFKGKVAVRLGPVALVFSGRAVIDSIDDATHSASIRAQGIDTKGRGGANAVMNFKLLPVDGGSSIHVETDLNLNGFVAQYGRGAGVVREVAAQLMTQFADALKAQLALDAAATERQFNGSTPARPISGVSLLARSLWSAATKRE